MLAQYDGGVGEDREGTVRAILEEPGLVAALLPLEDGAEVTAAGLTGHRLDWFRTLQPLARAAQRWLSLDVAAGDELGHGFMTAGEWAIEELARYGLVTASATGGRWTDRGRRLLGGAFPD